MSPLPPANLVGATSAANLLPPNLVPATSSSINCLQLPAGMLPLPNILPEGGSIQPVPGVPQQQQQHQQPVPMSQLPPPPPLTSNSNAAASSPMPPPPPSSLVETAPPTQLTIAQLNKSLPPQLPPSSLQPQLVLASAQPLPPEKIGMKRKRQNSTGKNQTMKITFLVARLIRNQRLCFYISLTSPPPTHFHCCFSPLVFMFF